jgi:transcriptional regulator with XRE-family HTH domain
LQHTLTGVPERVYGSHRYYKGNRSSRNGRERPAECVFPDSQLTGFPPPLPFLLNPVKSRITMTTLGQRIRELRADKQFTVQEFAKRIGEKTAGYVSRIEVRGEIPSAELLVVIADVLDVDPEELFRLAKDAQLGRVAEQIDAKQQDALVLYRKQKK